MLIQDLEKSNEDINKYELLVRHKSKKNAQPKYKTNAKEDVGG